MWTITSSASISTQSAAGSPSIRTFLPNRSLILSRKLNGHRRDLPRRAARRDHHMVGDVRFAGERDGDDLLRLVVVERLAARACGALRRRRALGRQRQLAAAFNGMFGQGVSWRTGRHGRRPTLDAQERSAIPAGVLRANGGCGGRVGRQAKENDRRCTPLRPVTRLARRVDEPPQPAHRARRVGS